MSKTLLKTKLITGEITTKEYFIKLGQLYALNASPVKPDYEFLDGNV